MSGEPSPPPAAPHRSRLRGLDRRTVGICVLIALIGALGAGLLASVLTDHGSSDATGSITITKADKVDTAKALRTQLLDFTGQKTTLSAKIGAQQPAVINFFSTTCGPCVAEMAAFERVHRSRTDVSFVGVDVQDQVSAGRGLIKRTGITYEALRDPPGDLLRAIGGVGLPTTVLVDSKGRVVATHTGALSERSLSTLISQKLG